MASLDYGTINTAIGDTTTSPSRALEGSYTDDPSGTSRKFLAYALGDGHTGPPPAVEVVLAWQYEGHHTDATPAENWRCFQVDKFVGAEGSKLSIIGFSSAWTPPEPLTGPQRARQNCVARGIMGPVIYRDEDYHT